MPQYGIKIFARLKPARRPFRGLGVQAPDELLDGGGTAGDSRHVLAVDAEDRAEKHQFRFDAVFPTDCTQGQVFAAVAQPVIDSALEGYNGTVFAYGQTGSGKTFTVTGGAECYEDRGIIPRTLSYLFEQYAKQPTVAFTTRVSYLEIYNECGYDLLDPHHEASKLEDLPKVTLSDDGDGGVLLRNLSVSEVGSEEDALNALFIGDTNRMIAETPMNMASTRSHCIFTIHISSRATGTATIRRAKLHLVDLAGSERVKKSGVAGVLLTEAKYINLSLHYLEQVIVALSERTRTHIPYRNSMMTSVLRDSLGGNCRTTMIATLAIEKSNIPETVSTCRFAQRVALVKNDARLNEETDPHLIIQKLRTELKKTRTQLALATGSESSDQPLTEEERTECHQMVSAFLRDASPDAALQCSDLRRVNLCFSILKGKVAEAEEGGASHTAEVEELRRLLLQRETEISVLAARLKGRSVDATARTPSEGRARSEVRDRPTVRWSAVPPAERPHDTGGAPVEDSPEFARFCQTYPDMELIRSKKRHLKGLYAAAKGEGEQVNAHRHAINALKSRVERLRIEQADRDDRHEGGTHAADATMSEEEAVLRHGMEAKKRGYRECLARLKSLKQESEHLQHLLRSAKLKLQRAFEVWQTGQGEGQGARRAPARTGQADTDDDIAAFFRARDSLR